MGDSGWGLSWYLVLGAIPLALLVRAFRSPAQQPWAPVWRWPIDTEDDAIEEEGAASEPRSDHLPDGIGA